MGHVEVMTVLLEGGANADSTHKFAKSTALHFAAEMGQPEAVRVLCKGGADPEKEKIQGGRALHTAADTNQTEVARVLIEVRKPFLFCLQLFVLVVVRI
jgi:ankyrin repeat protein